MTILDALIKLKNDLMAWCVNNFNQKLNKNLGNNKANGVLVTDESGNITIAQNSPTNEQLSYLNSVTSDIQTQIDTINNNKVDITHEHNISDVCNLSETLTSIQGKFDEIDGDVGNCIVSLSIDGQTITYTKDNGDTNTITTQDTNTMVTNEPALTTKAYVTGTVLETKNTGTQVFDTGVYLDTTAGQLVATIFKGNLDGNADNATNAVNAVNATNADNATNAVNAANADKATQDANGNVIDVTYETKSDANSKLGEAKGYTDQKIADLINGAPTTLDTLKEIADAMAENDKVVDLLNEAIGAKANTTDLSTHTNNTTNHITADERTKWNTAHTHSQAAHAPSDAQKNQNAFSNIAVSGQTTVAADTATDTVTFVGSNVSITTDATNDTITFTVADGSTSGKGVVQLENSTSSTSTTTAATPNSVKSAYDLANEAKTTAATAQSTANSKADGNHSHDEFAKVLYVKSFSNGVLVTTSTYQNAIG